jgi:hypothetical protein
MQQPVATLEGGLGTGLAPDVCYVPAPPPPPAGLGGIPTTFPNLGRLAKADKTTENVLIRNKRVLVEGSLIPSSEGDEAGCSTIVPPGKKGFKSMENMAKVEFNKHSDKVKFEGKGVITLTVTTKHNQANTAGLQGAPSQTVVLAVL